ncbi:uroporphyrinogen-III synthase [Alloyangia pacifica]|uniref:Uroporphyrinogen-III synthase n=1 Tax=Alloyangia pacifica TaxID=311180 RepID=A0A1I6U3V3_9RHOB|nr:uroporphyrinogen-III synthase [Alloyangia pacifica]SDH37199.1 uroporphyrinogen-III synthase [Alloyangia pacifica]SFS96130.1 uroporphyrinogen-III synthase [Alloyangia pacifica]
MPVSQPFLLLTRPRAASERFAAELAGAGVTGFVPLVSPLIEIETTGPLPEMAGITGLVFTSANGVRAYTELGGPVLPLCYAVGEATARAARDAGLAPRVAQGDAETLLALVLSERPGGRLLHLRGTHARGDLAARLTSAGQPCAEVVVYDQPTRPLCAAAISALRGQIPVVVPLFSPRSARIFAVAARNVNATAPLFAAYMSAEVEAALSDLYVHDSEIVLRPDAGLMRKSVEKLLECARSLVDRGGSVKSYGSDAGSAEDPRATD